MSSARPTHHRVLAALMAGLLACSTPAGVAAQAGDEPPPAGASAPPSLADSLTGSAKTDYESGKLLFSDGDNAGAKLKFESAYAASKDPRLLWNLAACEKNLRNYSKVLELLERYLADGDEKVTEEARARAVELKKTVRGFVADVTIRVDQVGAKIAVDGEDLGTSPLSGTVRLNQGSRVLRIKKPGFEPLELTVKLNGGEAKSIDVKLLKESAQARLRVSAGQGQKIVVDGRSVGSGEWEGFLKPGSHTVQVSAPGMRSYRSEFILEPKQTKVSTVTLDPLSRDSGGSLTPWLLGGAALAVGLGVAAFFVFKKDETKSVPEAPGTVPPGQVYLSF
ncbi:MAG: PEGA domain-containing protein [Myxococcales bacterium]|nr:PEGA domain-containing protein [Myxococcales bacterium]